MSDAVWLSKLLRGSDYGTVVLKLVVRPDPMAEDELEVATAYVAGDVVRVHLRYGLDSLPLRSSLRPLMRVARRHAESIDSPDDFDIVGPQCTWVRVLAIGKSIGFDVMDDVEWAEND